ncbi:MAG: hypothetical protein AAB390_03845 [Patescibacteria group bacterium]
MLEERIFDGVENTQIETSQPGDTGKKPIDVEMYASLIKIETLNLSEDALRGRLSGGGSVCWAYNKENFSLKIWYRTSDFERDLLHSVVDPQACVDRTTGWIMGRISDVKKSEIKSMYSEREAVEHLGRKEVYEAIKLKLKQFLSS